MKFPLLNIDGTKSTSIEVSDKIVKLKTDELSKNYSNQLNISEEIQKFLSTEIKSSIRELVGALNRIVSFARI